MALAKCADPACNCTVPEKGEFGKYCSEHCKEAGKITELRCTADHDSKSEPFLCRTWRQAREDKVLFLWDDGGPVAEAVVAGFAGSPGPHAVTARAAAHPTSEATSSASAAAIRIRRSTRSAVSLMSVTCWLSATT